MTAQSQTLSALDAMDYPAFLACLPALRAQYPGATDCTRTRLHDGPPLRLREAALAQLAQPVRGHRCHIAQAWAKRLAPLGVNVLQVLVSQGVRESLGLLMAAWRRPGGHPRRWALPADVYPVYAAIAAKNNAESMAYPLHPKLLPQAWGEADVLLVTNPVKPRGTALAPDEVGQVTAWLAQDPRRRVVVDAVYDLLPALDAGTQALWATRQAVVLQSLSKAWLSPLLAGVAVVPAADVAALTPVFRTLPGDGARLAQAEAWLQQAPAFPQQVGQAFEQVRADLVRRLQAAGLAPLRREVGLASATGNAVAGTPVPAYLVPVACSVEQGAEASFIGLPASAFGAAWQHHGDNGLGPVTVFSALPMLAA